MLGTSKVYSRKLRWVKGTLSNERALQFDYHRGVDHTHVNWQTTGAYFADTEARLLNTIDVAAHERLLEIGCGEGANLHHLRRSIGLRVGIDFSLNKVHAATRTGAQLACADATLLPFAEGTFDVVLIRDLLHHVPQRRQVLHEAFRVLKVGGRVHLIEPNALAPLVVFQAITVRAERGLLRSTEKRLRSELRGAGFDGIQFTPTQAFPIERALLHPHFGAPRLGAVPLVKHALDGFDFIARHIVPKRAWFYLCFSAQRP